jgi:hypothetical protein
VLYVSEDDGLTWTRRQVAAMPIPFTDPAVAADQNGTVYVTFVDAKGQLFYSHSKDKAATWTAPVAIATGITGTKPALDVGDPGKVVIAFPGTDQLPQGFQTADKKWKCPVGSTAQCVSWNANLAVSYNGLDAVPTFETVKANNDGPLLRGAGACANGGRCDAIVDFIDVTVGPDGRPYASFSRACSGKCLTDPKAVNNESTGKAMMVTLSSGPTLCSTGCSYKFRPSGA